MLLHKSVVHDSRVRREASALAEAGHEVIVLELDPHAEGTLDGFRRLSASPPAALRRWLPFHAYRAAFLVWFVARILRLRPDVVHAHDAAMLLPGLLGARLTGARLVYDSHELATGVRYRSRDWARFVAALERLGVPRADAVVTVTDGIAERLQVRYGLRERPHVVRNACALEAGAPDGTLRRSLGVGDAPLVLHQGAPAEGRGCELLVRAMGELAGVHLVFLGDGEPDFERRLREEARAAGVHERVHLVPGVPLERLLARTAEADVGVALLQDDCENHRLALPNKLFEYAAAGVPVVASDLPELRRVVDGHRLGALVPPGDRTALVHALRAVLAGGRSGAIGDLSWARERERLLAAYERLLAGDRAGPGPPGRPRALLFVRNPFTHDARVLRSAVVLRDMGYRPEVVAVTSTLVRERSGVVDGIPFRRLDPVSPLSHLRHLRRPGSVGGRPEAVLPDGTPVPPSLAVRLHRLLRTLDYYRRGVGVVLRERPALVHCNDYNTMWIGVAARGLVRARVLYDAHELWPDRNGRPEPRWWLLACEGVLVRCAHVVVTASPGFADVMARRYRIARPQVVLNVPERRSDVAPPRDRPDTVVYAGGLLPHRGIETAIRATALLPGITLEIIGPGRPDYREGLERLARELGIEARVRFQAPVPPADVLGAVAGAGVGLALFEPVCLSHWLVAPNKLFEYMAAGVPVLASDLPVIRDLLAEWPFGLLAGSLEPRVVAELLGELLDPAANARLRAVARAAAKDVSWPRERRVLASAYAAAVR